MKKERLNEKEISRNGRRENAGLALQAPVFHRPACRRLHHGSQIVEYGLLLAAISAALMGMYVYGRRGVQGVIRTTVDGEIGPQINGLQDAGFMGNDSSQSTYDTVSSDDSRGRLDATGIIYDTNSFSSSSGTASFRAIGG